MNKAKMNKQRPEPKPDDVIKLNKEAWERLQALIKSPPEPTTCSERAYAAVSCYEKEKGYLRSPFLSYLCYL